MDKYDELLARADASHRILSRELGAAIRELEAKLEAERNRANAEQDRASIWHVKYVECYAELEAERKAREEAERKAHDLYVILNFRESL